MLRSTEVPLAEAHDLVMLDLDGVVYLGDQPIPGVAESLEGVRGAGAHVAFITNNASRPPEEVAHKLRSMGIRAARDDVVTSAQAAARVLREQHGEEAAVLVVGGDGLRQALAQEGLRPVDPGEDLDGAGVRALVTGYGPDVRWRDIMQAAMLVRDGLPWVASNTDATLPTPRGMAPGHGVLVRTIAGFAGREPTVAGKPERPLLEETVRRVGGGRPVMVGDRLDTDIEGANRIGVASLLVLTGSTGLAELVAARGDQRPSYLSPDTGGLLQPHPVPRVEGAVVTAGGWRAEVARGRLVLDGEGSDEEWWRAAVVAAWLHLDEHDDPADVRDLAPPMPDTARSPG